MQLKLPPKVNVKLRVLSQLLVYKPNFKLSHFGFDFRGPGLGLGIYVIRLGNSKNLDTLIF